MSPNPLHSVVAEPAVEGRPAMHRPQGIYGWEGEGVIKSGKRNSSYQIADMAPTMMHMLGLEVDDHMDGKVMLDCFEDDYKQNNPVSIREGAVTIKARKFEGDAEEDDEKLLETMRALGYME
jgi:hypothetical protein